MRPFYIGTIRFTSEPFKENKKWREKNNWKGCIYGTSVPIAEHIEIDEKIIIIEMNNSTNQIEGIGYIMNHSRYDCAINMYKDRNYNRYIYRSNHRIDRKDIKLLKFLEDILFKGRSNSKRWHGIRIMPTKIEKRKLVLPRNILKRRVLEELKNGKPRKYIIHKYRAIQRELLLFLNNCFG